MARGSYIVLLRCERASRFDVGKLGSMTTQPGYYVYIGSAMGPGGLAARVAHHARTSRRPHWHIDYLRAHTDFEAAWGLASTERKECAWAREFSGRAHVTLPMAGFGASDCGCRSHLYHMPPGFPLERLFKELSNKNKGLMRIA